MATIQSGATKYSATIKSRLPYVDGSIVCAPAGPGSSYTESYAEFVMYLERQDWKSGTRGGWSVIDSRAGYVANGDPGHRTFSNIRTTGQPLRIRVVLMRWGNPETVTSE